MDVIMIIVYRTSYGKNGMLAILGLVAYYIDWRMITPGMRRVRFT